MVCTHHSQVHRPYLEIQLTGSPFTVRLLPTMDILTVSNGDVLRPVIVSICFVSTVPPHKLLVLAVVLVRRTTIRATLPIHE